jgi:urease accessory protein
MTSTHAENFAPPDAGWNAWLELDLVRRGEKSVLARVVHEGPLRIQRPFYPEGDQTCHVYLLHPPGGMVTGDALKVCASLSAGSQALVTTPSAGKIYRGDGSDRSQSQIFELDLAENTVLEWFPQETIVFDGARGESHTLVNLENETAEMACWDIVCLGRPASNDMFDSGYMVQNLHLQIAGKTRYRERNVFRGGESLMSMPWGMAGQPVAGTLLLSGEPDNTTLDQWRERVSTPGAEGLLGITCLDGLTAVRYLGPSAEHCKACFEQVWGEWRHDRFSRSASRPRIWNT